MREIELTKGKVALVDDEDFEQLNQFKWYFGWNGYAIRSAKGGNKKITMHRTVLQPPDNETIQVDHINRNKLDNRRENLRLVTPRQNRKNSGIRKSNKTGYIGVTRATARRIKKPWQAQIASDGKYQYLGCFNSLEKAALAYNKAAIKLHGEFAVLNDIKKGE